MLWLIVVFVISVWFLLLRPRRGGTTPLVLHAPAFPIPLVGVLMEFFKGPNDMIKRCHEQIGPVFTIPASTYYIALRG
jgi:hypothetical protein